VPQVLTDQGIAVQSVDTASGKQYWLLGPIRSVWLIERDWCCLADMSNHTILGPDMARKT